ncbi:MAG: anthranilate synthase component I family protein [Synechococcaceae cyanobacterium]
MSPLLRRKLPWCPPEALLRRLLPQLERPGLVWLDGDGSALGRRGVLALEPLAERVCRGLPGEAGAEDPFRVLAELEASGRPWLGWLAYEAGAWLEPATHWKRPAMAMLWAVQADPLLIADHQHQRLWLEGHDPQRLEALAVRLERAGADVPADHSHADTGGHPQAERGADADAPLVLPRADWHWHTSRADFADQVRAVRDHIAGGDLFQANLTACCEQELAEPPGAAALLGLYGRLRRHCPAPFAGLAIGGPAAAGEAVLSASPERFLQLTAEGSVETRPIKGTRPRHAEPGADADAAAELITSPKDRAENVMIVDLLRNDLGRVCRPGSIQVSQLLGLESYRQVHHLTSVVRGRLQPGLGAADLLRACWPGGSITGAPKIRACRRLGELEPVPRGPYCGSLFHLDGAGGFDSNILIRSLFLDGRRLRAHGGCGIVADSDPEAEAEELDWKLRPLLEALELCNPPG